MGSADMAGASPATSSAKIYACYSDKTDALTYLNYPTVKKCASGETLISWNATGAQGAQGAKGSAGAQGAQGSAGAQGAKGSTGAQGAQGSAGAQGHQGAQGPNGTVGFYSTTVTSDFNRPAAKSVLVRTLDVPDGYWAVNVDGTVGTFAGEITCVAKAVNSQGIGASPTNVAIQPDPGAFADVGMTGGMFIIPGSTIGVFCDALAPSFSAGSNTASPNVFSVESMKITATQVAGVNNGVNVKSRRPGKPLNSFSTRLPRPTKR
jgi:hypothetical protein